MYALGRALGVGEVILNAAPTDGLWGDDRTDEDQLGATYDELEWAMEQVAAGRAADAFVAGSREAAVLKSTSAPPGQPAQDGPHPGLRTPGFALQLSLTLLPGWPNLGGQSFRRQA